MKRTIILLLLCIVAATTFHAVKSASQKKTSTLVLENVEALASGELSGGGCAGVGCTYCPTNGEKVKYVFSGYKLQ